MPDLAEVHNFTTMIRRLASHAVDAVGRLVAATEGDIQALADAYPSIAGPYAAAAGLLTAHWYDSLAPASDFPVEAAPLPSNDELAASARWALTQPDTEAALAGSTERRVFNAQRDTIVTNAAKEGVRYYRLAQPDACPWCQVLALHGAVYHSAAKAQKSHTMPGHDTCRCVATPLREGDTYQRPDYMDQWEADYEAAYRDVKHDDPHAGLNDIVNHMRRSARARANASQEPQESETSWFPQQPTPTHPEGWSPVPAHTSWI